MAISNDACKNLIDAMQKIHLAATAAALALLSNALLFPTSVTKTASGEMEQLLRIKEHADASRVRELLTDAIATKVDISPSDTRRFYISSGSGIQSDTLNIFRSCNLETTVPQIFSVSKDNEVVWASGSEEKAFQSHGGIVSYNSQVAEFDTFESFQNLWDNLLATQRIFQTNDEIHVTSLRGPKQVEESNGADVYSVGLGVQYPKFTIKLSPDGLYTANLTADKQAAALERNYHPVGHAVPEAYAFENKILEYHIRLQFDAEFKDDVTPLDALLSKAALDDRIYSKKFIEAFPNLSAYVQDKNERLISIKNRLLEKTSEKQEFDLFGVKIGSDQIAIFGLPTLAILLLNFGAVARYVAKHAVAMDVEVVSNWSFLLKGWLFGLLALAVVIVLPLGSVIVTWIYLHDRTPQTVVMSCMAIISILFAGHSMFLLRSRSITPENESKMNKAP
jgi:hypothetical protein